MPNLTINGQSYFVDAPPDTPLLWVIREDLRLTGTKYGCGVGLCGSCKVHIDGQAVPSCSIPVGTVEGSIITTIEGLNPANAHPAQQAWIGKASSGLRRMRMSTWPSSRRHCGRIATDRSRSGGSRFRRATAERDRWAFRRSRIASSRRQ